MAAGRSKLRCSMRLPVTATGSRVTSAARAWPESVAMAAARGARRKFMMRFSVSETQPALVMGGHDKSMGIPFDGRPVTRKGCIQIVDDLRNRAPTIASLENLGGSGVEFHHPLGIEQDVS